MALKSWAQLDKCITQTHCNQFIEFNIVTKQDVNQLLFLTSTSHVYQYIINISTLTFGIE